jgi:hypothetical protein
MSLLRFVLAYFKTQQALQWWSKKQSMYLLQESHQIRDQLLQQSFAIRRNIERDLAEGTEALPQKSQVWLNQLEQFHRDLEKLSDRLVPAYAEDSLPIAVQYLINSWQTRHPQVNFQLDIIGNWKPDSSARNLIIIKILDELFKIALAEHTAKTSIKVYLELNLYVDIEKVKMIYFNRFSIPTFSKQRDLEYLCKTFQFLTSGQYSYNLENFQESLCFYWKYS